MRNLRSDKNVEWLLTVSILLRGNWVAQPLGRHYYIRLGCKGFNPLARQLGCATNFESEVTTMGVSILLQGMGLRNGNLVAVGEVNKEFQSSCETTGLCNPIIYVQALLPRNIARVYLGQAVCPHQCRLPQGIVRPQGGRNEGLRPQGERNEGLHP